ncbi:MULTISPECIES: GntR family transcriptional regulator [unclassified Achromobacter]|uniref:GntR family transcriptional regulator n=1 Tax=unclassified Achromobacter TaxID=2626865 RepID=UPI001E3CFE21|nr:MULTISPECIES: FCD domain-containing protein [unclassified Achromobacter]
MANQVELSIQNGVVGPGERLKEETLADRYAVSRTTVREAIGVLERRGLVERVPRFGARVREIDASGIEEIFCIRAQLLGLAARRVAQSRDEATLAQLRRQIERLRQMADKSSTSPAVYARTSIETQQLLINAVGWKQLPAMYEGLGNQVLWKISVRGRSLSFQTPQRRSESAGDWQRLLDAVEAGEPAAAEESAKQLLAASFRAVQERLGDIA